MARSVKPPDFEEQIHRLAKLGCTYWEIAAVLGCSESLLHHKYCSVIRDGHQKRNCSLRRKQFAIAMKGNPQMLIWLGKQYLEQKDQVVQEHGGSIQINVVYEDYEIPVRRSEDSGASWDEAISKQGRDEPSEANQGGHTRYRLNRP